MVTPKEWYDDFERQRAARRQSEFPTNLRNALLAMNRAAKANVELAASAKFQEHVAGVFEIPLETLNRAYLRAVLLASETRRIMLERQV